MHKARGLQMLNSNLLIISSSFLCALHPPNVLLVFHFPLSWLYIIFHVTLVCLEQPHKESWQGLLLHITPGDPSALGSFPAVRTHLVIFFCTVSTSFFGLCASQSGDPINLWHIYLTM